MQTTTSYELSLGGETGKAAELVATITARLNSFSELERVVSVSLKDSAIVLNLGDLFDFNDIERDFILSQLLDFINEKKFKFLLEKDPRITITETDGRIVNKEMTPLLETYTRLQQEKDVLKYPSDQKLKSGFFTNQAVFSLKEVDTKTVTVSCKPRVLTHHFVVRLMVADFQDMLVKLIANSISNCQVAAYTL